MIGIAVISALIAVAVRHHSVARAKRELEERRRASLMDPGLIPIALQIGQTLGWRRLAALAGVGLFAVGLAREWLGDCKDKPGEGDPG